MHMTKREDADEQKQSLTRVFGLRRNATFSMCMTWKVCGSKEPQLKIMGIEAVKSHPHTCREKIKQALKIIMSGDEKALNAFIQEFREEFMNPT